MIEKESVRERVGRKGGGEGVRVLGMYMRDTHLHGSEDAMLLVLQKFSTVSLTALLHSIF